MLPMPMDCDACPSGSPRLSFMRRLQLMGRVFSTVYGRLTVIADLG